MNKSNKTRNILDCDQPNVLLVRIIFFCILSTAFQFLSFHTASSGADSIISPTASTVQLTSSPHVTPNVKLVTPLSLRRHTSITVLDKRMVLFILTMRLSSTVMEIWPFEVLPRRLFWEQRSVVGRSVGRSVNPQYYTDLIYSSSLRQERSARRVKNEMCVLLYYEQINGDAMEK